MKAHPVWVTNPDSSPTKPITIFISEGDNNPKNSHPTEYAALITLLTHARNLQNTHLQAALRQQEIIDKLEKQIDVFLEEP